MKLSVIITSYNHAHTLRRAIDSVISACEGISYEIIIVDDGSTDGSVNIIEDYKDYRIRRFRRPHEGMLKTYQYGISKVRGEYFKFVDCDDYLVGEGVRAQLRYMDTFGYNFTVTKVIIERGKTKELPYYDIDWLQSNLTYDNLLKGKAVIWAQSYMIRTSRFNEIIDFSKFLKFSVWDLPIVLTWLKHEPIKYLNLVTSTFVIDGESATNTTSRVRRFKHLFGYYKIKLNFILKYGCRLDTLLYLAYKVTRDLYSVCFKRWLK